MASWGDVGRVSPAERGRHTVERARNYEAEVNVLLTPGQQRRLRQIGLQAEGPGAFGQPEVVSELKLTAEQRERIWMVEEEAIFGWMRAPRPGTRPGAAESKDRSANERILAVLTEEQSRRWKEMTGEPLKGGIAPFGPPPGPKGP